MGGGKRKPSHNNKPKYRTRQSKHSSALFVEGGILSGFDSPLTLSPSLPGRSYKARSGNNGSTSKSTNSNKGLTKCSNPNIFHYDYPKGNMQSESCSKERNTDGDAAGTQAVILLGPRDSKIVAYEDQAPSVGASEVKYSYEYSSGFVLGDSSHGGLGYSDEPDANPGVSEYSSGFVLGDSSHGGLGYSDEPDANPGVSELSSGMIEEDEQLHRGLGFAEQPEAGADVMVLSSTIVQEEGDLGYDSSSHEIEQEDADEGSMDEDDSELLQDRTPSTGKNSAFVSIGGIKLYTEDISDEETDDYQEEGDTEEEHSDEGSSSESSDSNDSEDSSDFDSDIDEDIMEDYLDGIGGSSQILKSKWLASQNLDGQMARDDSDDDSSSDEYGNTLNRLSGVALQEASREYGMQKGQSKTKPTARSSKANAASVGWSSSVDDLMLVKDPRKLSAKKKHASRLPQSWPSRSRKSKNFGRYPGEKKKERKERIAVKRRERMLHRGVDLEKINLKLKQMVLNNGDMLAFQPMHSKDCSQVQRLAAIYRLRSGCLGSAKKRFVTVSRTQHTSMPSASDEVRLEKLIGTGKDDADFPVVDTPQRGGSRSAKSKSTKISASHRGSSSRSERRSSGKKPAAYASQPMSFVSSGVMESDSVQPSVLESTENSNLEGKTIDSTSSVYGSFEVHTTGFGSKMLAKMGFVEGGGLGKDGKGMAQPIEVTQRPKSLGLGMAFDESCTEPLRVAKGESAGVTKGEPRTVAKRSGWSGRKSAPNIGGFEQHTKGFGSKMMAKMGFIKGSGLGRNSQGIATPLTAVRRPRARGLGAENR